MSNPNKMGGSPESERKQPKTVSGAKKVAIVATAFSALAVGACSSGSDTGPDDGGSVSISPPNPDEGVDTGVETQTMTSMELTFNNEGDLPEYNNSTVTLDFSDPVEVGSDGIINFPDFTEISIPLKHTTLGGDLFYFETREDISQSGQAGFRFADGGAPGTEAWSGNNNIVDTTFSAQKWGPTQNGVLKIQALGGTRGSIHQLRYRLEDDSVVYVVPNGGVQLQ